MWQVIKRKVNCGIKRLKHKSKSNRAYRLALWMSRALLRELMACERWWRSYPAYTLALVLILIVGSFGLKFIRSEDRKVENLRLELSAQRKLYEEKIGGKKQRLAAALSHLEDNPVVTAPGNNQSLSGPIVKMEWKYRGQRTGEDQNMVNTEAGQSAEYTSAGQYSHKHSILEIRNVATPLQNRTILVTGDTAWYPITFLDKLDQQGKYLWRVIPASMDSSGKQHAEGNWGPFFVFSLYRSAYDRIKATNKMLIGAYGVEQLALRKFSTSKPSCSEALVGLSDSESKLICFVGASISKVSNNEINGEVEPVVKQYSDIDNTLIPLLKAGELDIAFGSISKANYRAKKGLLFVEYMESEPMLLTNDDVKAKAEEIGKDDVICTYRGTVYEDVAKNIMKEQETDTKKRRYNFTTCQNTYDAIDKLNRNEISWVFMDKRTWDDIDKKKTYKLYPNNTSEVRKRVKDELKGDAFAMTDKELCLVMCKAVKVIKNEQHLQNLQNIECSCNPGS